MSNIRLKHDDDSYLKFVLEDPIGWVCYKFCQYRYPEWFEETKRELEQKRKKIKEEDE